MNWQALQNGSDIRGVALRGVEGESVNLSAAVAETLGKAFGNWLASKLDKSTEGLRVAIGMDSRISGPTLFKALSNGLTSLGCQVADCGLASTPAMFMSTVLNEHCYHGAVMLTASHLPFNRNGMKFFTKQGGLDKKDISAILTLAEQGDFQDSKVCGSVSPIDLMSVYAQLFVEKIRREVDSKTNPERPLTGFKIVVDAGNGAGGFYVDQVLLPLGADTTGSQFLEPDGNFPNHVPNPENKEAMAAIRQAVLEHQADFGLIFDTDVDRGAAVDHRGEEIDRNRLIALASAIVLEEHPGSTIVTDSITSDGLGDFIEQVLGGKHHRFKRGYKNVINEAIRLNQEGKESWLAIETSGHAAMKENYFLDDGAYLLTKFVIKLAQMREQGRDLLELIKALPMPAEGKEYRIKITEKDFKQYGTKIIEDLRAFTREHRSWSLVPNNYEGIRVSCPNAWFLLRLSLHDPVMPLNVESEIPGGVKLIAGEIGEFLSRYAGLELAAAKL